MSFDKFSQSGYIRNLIYCAMMKAYDPTTSSTIFEKARCLLKHGEEDRLIISIA